MYSSIAIDTNNKEHISYWDFTNSSLKYATNALTCTDNDNDGYGNPASASCAHPELDCNDNNPLECPNQTWYADTDGDGYSNGSMIIQCTRPTGYKVVSELIATSGDCNDSNGLVNPSVTEIPNNGIDDDCNPATPVLSVSGSGNNYPVPLFRASLTLNVNASSLGISSFSYYYTRARLYFVSTSITGISVTGGVATITGSGKVNNVTGYIFTVTITDGSTDKMGLEVRKSDGTLYYSAASNNLTSGNFTVTGQ